MPGARLVASITDRSPRARIVAPSMTEIVAGVSSGVRPRRLPVAFGVVSVSRACWPTTRMSSLSEAAND